MDAPAVAHRLALSGPEWRLLCQRAGLRPPPGFGATDQPPGQESPDSAGSLAGRGVLRPDSVLELPVPAVAANLAVLAAPAAVVQVGVSVRGDGLRAVYAVRGPLGASLVTLPAGGVELSMFPAVDLGRELARCAPAPERLAAPDPVRTALGSPAAPSLPLSGRLPLAALTESAPAWAFGYPAAAAGLGLTRAEAALATAASTRATGVLHALVVGGSGPAGSRRMLAGQVVWLATGTGWVGVRPHPDGSGRQLVDLVPVGHPEIGGWLAPYLARILAAADG